MNCEVIDVIIGGVRHEITVYENGGHRIIKFPFCREEIVQGVI